MDCRESMASFGYPTILRRSSCAGRRQRKRLAELQLPELKTAGLNTTGWMTGCYDLNLIK